MTTTWVTPSSSACSPQGRHKRRSRCGHSSTFAAGASDARGADGALSVLAQALGAGSAGSALCRRLAEPGSRLRARGERGQQGREPERHGEPGRRARDAACAAALPASPRCPATWCARPQSCTPPARPARDSPRYAAAEAGMAGRMIWPRQRWSRLPLIWECSGKCAAGYPPTPPNPNPRLGAAAPASAPPCRARSAAPTHGPVSAGPCSGRAAWVTA